MRGPHCGFALPIIHTRASTRDRHGTLDVNGLSLVLERERHVSRLACTRLPTPITLFCTTLALRLSHWSIVIPDGPESHAAHCGFSVGMIDTESRARRGAGARTTRPFRHRVTGLFFRGPVFARILLFGNSYLYAVCINTGRHEASEYGGVNFHLPRPYE